MSRLSHFLIFLAFLSLFCQNKEDTPKGTDSKSLYGSYGFAGQIFNDLGRVKIPVENKTINIGQDFTIEFWLKMEPQNNPGGTVNENATDGSGWVTGHIIMDRDIDDTQGTNSYGDYGIALAQGKPAFGVAKGHTGKTIYASSSPDLRDGNWHHIAVTRNGTTGQMHIFVDGILRASGTGPGGDIRYQNGRTTTRPNSDPYFVLGCEKHDFDHTVLGYEGLLTGLRISSTIRYHGNFTVSKSIPPVDSHTVALYLFQEWDGQNLKDETGQNPGIVQKAPNAPYPSPDHPWE